MVYKQNIDKQLLSTQISEVDVRFGNPPDAASHKGCGRTVPSPKGLNFFCCRTQHSAFGSMLIS